MLECAAGLESQTEVTIEQRLTALEPTRTSLSAHSDDPEAHISYTK